MAIRRNEATGEDDETRALAREMGRRAASQLEASQARMMAENGATGRWLQGALVLLNGGGLAIITTHADKIGGPAIAPAIIFFLFGASLAVVAALASAVSALVMARHVGEASGHWTQVSVTGEISEAALKAARSVRRQSQIWSAAPIVIALASLLLFMTGALTLADGVAPQVAPEAALPLEPEPDNSAPAIENSINPTPAPANAALPVAATPSPTPSLQATPSPAAQRQPPSRRQAPRAPRRPPASAPAQSPAAIPAPAPAPASTPPAPAAGGN